MEARKGVYEKDNDSLSHIQEENTQAFMDKLHMAITKEFHFSTFYSHIDHCNYTSPVTCPVNPAQT